MFVSVATDYGSHGTDQAEEAYKCHSYHGASREEANNLGAIVDKLEAEIHKRCHHVIHTCERRHRKHHKQGRQSRSCDGHQR